MEDLSELKKLSREKRRSKRRRKRVAIVALVAIWVVLMVAFIVLQLSTNGSHFFLTLGRLQWTLGWRDSAIGNFFNACKRSPEKESLSSYTEAMKASGRSKEIDAQLSTIPSSSTNQQIVRALIKANLELSNFARAEQLCNDLIKANPKSADAYLMRARLYEQMKRYSESQSDYVASNSLLRSSEAVDGLMRVRQRLVWRENPYTDVFSLRFTGDRNNPVDKLTHAFRLTFGGELPQALALFTDLIDHKQLLASAYAGRGHVYQKMIKPKDALADLDLAETYLKAESPTGEVEHSRYRFMGENGNHIKLTRLDVIYSDRALARMDLEQYELALQEINKAIARKDLYEYVIIRADIYQKLGKEKEYLQDKKALQTRKKTLKRTSKENAKALFDLMRH